MKNQDEQIDKLFQKGLDNYEETPSSSAWDSIDDQLGTKKSSSKYWVAASVVAILLTSTVIWNSILGRTNTLIYETNEISLKANYPQKEFISLPILIHTNTIVYVEREIYIDYPDKKIALPFEAINTVNLSSSLVLKPVRDYYALNSEISESSSVELVYTLNEPITIIYKKGDPKHPILAKAANFFKQVGEGERPLFNLEKISTNVLARRNTNNNSNN